MHPLLLSPVLWMELTVPITIDIINLYRVPLGLAPIPHYSVRATEEGSEPAE